MQSNWRVIRQLFRARLFVSATKEQETEMMNRNPLLKATLASVMAVGATMMTANANAVPDNPKQWEKCAGIAKKGMNDCGALDGKHSCAGQAKIDNADNEWVYVPAGTCTKITGGFVTAVKPAK
jgi:uncharacterized membrane protein